MYEPILYLALGGRGGRLARRLTPPQPPPRRHRRAGRIAVLSAAVRVVLTDAPNAATLNVTTFPLTDTEETAMTSLLRRGAPVIGLGTALATLVLLQPNLRGRLDLTKPMKPERGTILLSGAPD